jgi:hypothetical protein
MWPHGTDPIWNSPNLRRFSLRSLTNNTTCSWEPSADKKYQIGYITICRQDLDATTLGFSVCGNKPTQDGHYGAVVTHVVPGSIMNIVCKLKVGDEIVEFNGYDLRNKGNEEVTNIIESAKSSNSLRLVAVRLTGIESTHNNSL